MYGGDGQGMRQGCVGVVQDSLFCFEMGAGDENAFPVYYSLEILLDFEEPVRWSHASRCKVFFLLVGRKGFNLVSQ